MTLDDLGRDLSSGLAKVLRFLAWLSLLVALVLLTSFFWNPQYVVVLTILGVVSLVGAIVLFALAK